MKILILLILSILLLSSFINVASLNNNLRRRVNKNLVKKEVEERKKSIRNSVLEKFKTSSREIVEKAENEAAKTLSTLLPMSSDDILDLEEQEEEEEETSFDGGYPVDPEQFEVEERDEKYERAMDILKGIVRLGDSNFSSSPSIPPVMSQQQQQQPSSMVSQDDLSATMMAMSSPQMTPPPQLQMPPQFPSSFIPDDLLHALKTTNTPFPQEEGSEVANSSNPAILEAKYMEALARAQAQERLNEQERMISERVRQEHEAALARAQYDSQMVDYLKNMTAQWEAQANASSLAANKTESMMMEINGAQVARAKLERAAQDEIAAQREHALAQAQVKQYEDALAQLKDLEKNATARKENTSVTLEEAFELFQKNSNQTASAALAKNGGVDILGELGVEGHSDLSGTLQVPPGLSPPLGMSSGSRGGSMTQPTALFAKLVPPPLGNIAMGPGFDVSGDVGVSNAASVVKDSMEKAGYPMIDGDSSSSSSGDDDSSSGSSEARDGDAEGE